MADIFPPDGPSIERFQARNSHPAGTCALEEMCSGPLSIASEATRVRFVAQNGLRYLVDISSMVQQNLNSGRRREVRRERSRLIWEYDSATRRGKSRCAKWTAYPNEVQVALEQVFRTNGRFQETCSVFPCGNSPPPHDDDRDGAPALGRLEFYCGGLPPGGVPLPLEPHSHPSLIDISRILQEAIPGSLGHDALRKFCDAALTHDAEPQLAWHTLQSLVRQHSFRCIAKDARRATLFIGSMAILRLMFQSNSDLQLHGIDIFDRRYPGLIQLNDEGRKRCLKAMLARGARLGPASLVPTSKLLRKIEADAFPEWVRRYFRSMTLAGLALPDNVQATIEACLCKNG